MIDYNGKKFRSVSNSANGEVSNETVFHYTQIGLHITAAYSGGNIVDGSLSATADEAGNLTMRYQHVNINGEFLTGTCFSQPEIMPNGKIRLYEKWQWTCGDYSYGESVAEEV
ncbi:MAG: hypothetical protein ABIQ88_18635 [Chitinophagaceae bacterium]